MSAEEATAQQRKPIALFDLDGTLADYDGALNRGLALIASPHEPPLGPSMGREHPKWLEQRRALITRQPGWFRNLDQYQPGFTLLAIAEALGFETHVLTKGPRGCKSAWTEKAEWCDINVPGRPVHVVTNKGLVYGRVLVDDWLPYGLAWLEWRPRGLLIVPAHPWNEGFEHPNAIRFDDTNIDAVRARFVVAIGQKDPVR